MSFAYSARPHERRRHMVEGASRAVTFAFIATLAALLSGCFGATFNVRAQRAYSNEEAIPEIIVDRAQDVVAIRALTIRLLTATPYTPADEWVSFIGLEKSEAASLRAEISRKAPYKVGEMEIPIVKLYRLHLERRLAAASAPRSPHALYPSVIDALATLTPEANDLKSLWLGYQAANERNDAAIVAEQKLREDLTRRHVALPPFAPSEPVELTRARNETASTTADAARAAVALEAVIDALGRADLSGPLQDRIARDGLFALSISLRATLEGQALIPVVKVEYARAVQSAEREIFAARPANVEASLGLSDVSALMQSRESTMPRDVEILQRAQKLLGSGVHVRQDDTPGFALRESIVDQVLGIQWDAVHAHAELDGEVMFFHEINTNGIDGNYTGRTRRLQYSVSPVATLGGHFSLGFDWAHIQNAASLNASFDTDRFYNRNGVITESGSLAKELGLKGIASDVVDLAADLVGIRTRVKYARFTTGHVSEIAVDPSTGRDQGVVGRAPLQVGFTQVDVAYDTARFIPPEVVGTYWIEEMLVGFRYMNYRLPRIVYELYDNSPPRSKNQNFVFSRESAAQKISSNYFMGGFTFRFGQGAEHIVSLFGDLGAYGGAGKTRYVFDDQQKEQPTAVVVNLSTGLGARIRLTPRTNQFRVLIEAQYHAEGVYQTVISSLRAAQTKDGTTYTVDRKVDFGGTDVFHGPRVQMVGVF